MAKESIWDRCNVNANLEDDKFVGIQFNNGEVSVHFPLGFNYEQDTDDELREDILMLIQTIGNTIGHKKSGIAIDSGDFTDTAFPIRAYLNVIQDYYVRGYYKETETQYKEGLYGKVNWGRTIKTQCASIQDDETYYLKLVVRKNKMNDNELITLIHKYCVYESFDKIGWLFTSFKPEKPLIRYNENIFKNVIKDKLMGTFNDRNKQLFLSMLAIVEYQGDKNAPTQYLYGTNRFEYVWEKLIDYVYGIEDKQEYFPKTTWHIKGKGSYDSSKLMPDSIMIYNENVYILDAKYYKYGCRQNPAHLPSSASINKQITYGEYAEKKREEEKKNFKIYNAFIMPFDSSYDCWKEQGSPTVVNIGEAVSQWKNGNKDYEKVQGILLDTKHLMNIVVRQEQTEIMELAEKIAENFNNKKR